MIIAHRLSTLRAVDEIVVFDHGRVVEHGARAELVGDDESRFARLLTLALEHDADVSTRRPGVGDPVMTLVEPKRDRVETKRSVHRDR